MNEIPAAPLFLLYVATTKVGYVLSAALEGEPFTVEEAVVLNQIQVLEPVTPSTLAARLGISPSTLSYRLRTLEKRRLLLRSANPDDGRSALISLSALGRRRWERALPSWRGAVRAVEEALELPQDEVDAALRAVIAATDRVLAEQSYRGAARL
jgi:DNA-binding MarR family transcriptional regulator